MSTTTTHLDIDPDPRSRSTYPRCTECGSTHRIVLGLCPRCTDDLYDFHEPDPFTRDGKRL